MQEMSIEGNQVNEDIGKGHEQSPETYFQQSPITLILPLFLEIMNEVLGSKSWFFGLVPLSVEADAS